MAKALRRLKKHRLALIGAAIILALAFVAALASFIAPHNPLEQNLRNRLLPPTSEYPSGTDNLSRCILSRLIYGTKISLQIGVMVVSITAGIGITLGLIASYRGGLLDELIMRIVDILLIFPDLIPALVIADILDPSLYHVMLALAIVGWTGYARVVRGSVLSVKEKKFVEAAQALGTNKARIIFWHILPSVTAPVIVIATLGMIQAILASGRLKFFRIGSTTTNSGMRFDAQQRTGLYARRSSFDDLSWASDNGNRSGVQLPGQWLEKYT